MRGFAPNNVAMIFASVWSGAFNARLLLVGKMREEEKRMLVRESLYLCDDDSSRRPRILERVHVCPLVFGASRDARRPVFPVLRRRRCFRCC
jgi:hypothetical protein